MILVAALTDAAPDVERRPELGAPVRAVPTPWPAPENPALVRIGCRYAVA